MPAINLGRQADAAQTFLASPIESGFRRLRDVDPVRAPPAAAKLAAGRNTMPTEMSAMQSHEEFWPAGSKLAPPSGAIC